MSTFDARDFGPVCIETCKTVLVKFEGPDLLFLFDEFSDKTLEKIIAVAEAVIKERRFNEN